MESEDGSAAMATSCDSLADVLKIKEWEVGMFQNEVAASQGIRIRRRPPTVPPLHYVGHLSSNCRTRSIYPVTFWKR